MSFSNQVIVPRDPLKPHIVKLQGLWRVSPYQWKKLWPLGIGSRWIEAHILTNRLNDTISAEQYAAKERQREWKRNEQFLLQKEADTIGTKANARKKGLK